MPNNINDETQRNVGFKHAQGVINTDADKSTIEETTFTTGYITGEEILASKLAFNNPADSIASGVVSSGNLVMIKDTTVGGAYRAYTSPASPVIHPQKHGNQYAPFFYHSSGILIPAGDLYAYSTFYYDTGSLVIQRNETTDAWQEPFLIDGFFYEGEFGFDTSTFLTVSGDLTNEINSLSGTLSNNIQLTSGEIRKTFLSLDDTPASYTIPSGILAVSNNLDEVHIAKLADYGPDRVVTVGQSQYADFATIEEAINSITDASSTNVYVIEIEPGNYVINNPFTLKRNVDLLAAGTDVGPGMVRISPADPNEHIFISRGEVSIQDIVFEGVTGVDKAAICADHGPFILPTVTNNISFLNCNNGLKLVSGSVAVCINTAVTITAPFQTIGTVFDLDQASQIYCNGAFASASAALLPFYADNPIGHVFNLDNGSFGFIDSCSFNIAHKNSNGAVIEVNNDSVFIVNGTNIQNAYAALKVGSGGGTNTHIAAQSIHFSNNTWNFLVEDASGFISVQGIADEIKRMTVDGARVDGFLTTVNDNGVDLLGNIKYVFENNENFLLTDHFIDRFNSGLQSGGIISSVGVNSYEVNISPGAVWVADPINFDLHKEHFDASTVIAPSGQPNLYIYFDHESRQISGSVSLPGNPNVIIGQVSVGNSGVLHVHNTSEPSNILRKLDRYFEETRKKAFVTGGIVTSGSVNTQVTIGSAAWYAKLNRFSTPQRNDPGFTYHYNNDLFTIQSMNFIDDIRYDSGGVLAEMPDGHFKVDSLYISDDASVTAVYGTQVYESAVLARDITAAPIPSEIEPTGIPLANLIVGKGSGIVEIEDRRPITNTADRLTGVGGGGAITEHGELLGLTDDDHMQYLLVNGNRPMAGVLDLGGNQVINASTYNNVNIQNHSARHDPGGADALSIGTPVSLGATLAPGTANSYARSDHVHTHGNLPGGSLHSVATTSTAGFLSAADKVRYDNDVDSGNIHFARVDNPHSTSLVNLTDTTITSPVSGQTVYYNGTNWINVSSDFQSTAGTTGSTVTDGAFINVPNLNLTTTGHVKNYSVVFDGTFESSKNNNIIAIRLVRNGVVIPNTTRTIEQTSANLTVSVSTNAVISVVTPGTVIGVQFTSQAGATTTYVQGNLSIYGI